jgi:choline dehydrogenase-like flavoprotein
MRATCETVYHPSGTCKMGTIDDSLSVVTPDLKVKGIAGLRVADASVFASMVTVNICNTVMMIAERAAELIYQD